MARLVSPALTEFLVEEGIQDSLGLGLGKAGITSLEILQKHSVDQVEESLQRSVAYGKKFILSSFERAALSDVCVGRSPSGALAGPPRAVAAGGGTGDERWWWMPAVLARPSRTFEP